MDNEPRHETTPISLQLVSSNPFLREQGQQAALIRHYDGKEAFLKKAVFKASLFKTHTTPILRKLRTLNVR